MRFPFRLTAPRLALAAAVAGTAAVPFFSSPAHSAQSGYEQLAGVERTMRIDSPVSRSNCATTRLSPRRGVAATSWTAPQPAFVTARLEGPAGSDWDLAVFDRATGQRVTGSSAWGASELVQAYAAAGRQLDFQACRVRGAGDSANLTLSAVRLPNVETSVPAKLVSIKLDDRRDFGVLTQMGIDLADHGTADEIKAVIHSQEEMNLLHRKGFATTVKVADLAANDREAEAKDRAYSARVAASALPSGRTQYRILADVQADLKKLRDQYPAIVRPVTLPKKTFQGRDTVGVEISADVHRTDDQKPVSFIMGVHHAREWPSAELTTEFALHLAQVFGTDPEVTEMLRRVRVVVVPVINGDGFVSSRESPDPADNSGDPEGVPSTAESAGGGGTLAYRRKNCHGTTDNPSAPCTMQVGIDPNRNYGFGWGGPGASSLHNSQTYRGSGPWSEPETQAVHEYSQIRDVTSLLTMHNFASLVLRPPGLKVQGTAPDEQRLKVLGDAMADDTGYTSQYGWQLYDTSGTTEDWNYGATGTFGYTMELGPESGDQGGFHINYERGVVEQWEGRGSRKGRGVRKALLRVAQWAASRPDFSTLYGRAPAGRILRLRKNFNTMSSPVCQIVMVVDLNLGSERPDQCINPGAAIATPDKLDYTTKVPANGIFSWIVTPSTRPFEYKAGRRESYTLTCEDTSGRVYQTLQVQIWRGEQRKLDLPCGGTLPGPGRTLRDRLAPRSSFNLKNFRPNRSGVTLRGTSVDRAPQGLTPQVAKVMISLWRRRGPKGREACRFITAQGVFGRKSSCYRLRFVPAQVNRVGRRVSWSYKLGLRLPAGLYIARVRGVDANGNVETVARKANGIKFRIR